MKLHEYQAREIFEKHGIPVPKAILAENPQEVEAAATHLGCPVVLKAQILVAGRGKAGGVKLAESPQEAKKIASALLGSSIKGMRVEKLLVAERVKSFKELYIGFTIDRHEREPVMIASASGGVDFEELAKTSPAAIVKHPTDLILGLHEYEARDIAKTIGLPSNLVPKFAGICVRLYQAFKLLDADLIESNPLVVTESGELVAVDSRITLDDNALFRHKDIQRSEEELTSLERDALKRGLAFVELDGDVGIVGNGAGLVMASLDIVAYFGGKPANFLDVGGGAGSEVVQEGIQVVMKLPNVRVVFINILGGITRCDEVASGIVTSMETLNRKAPFVVRLVGTNEQEGRRILDEAKIPYLDSMEDAAREAVKIARSQNR